MDKEKANKANVSLQKRIDKLLNSVQYADEQDMPDIFRQIKELRAQMVKVPEEKVVSKEACDAFIENFFNFEGKSYTEKKLIIRKVLCKIVVGDELYLTTNIDGEVYCLVIQ